jgi:hypothetical protein
MRTASHEGGLIACAIAASAVLGHAACGEWVWTVLRYEETTTPPSRSLNQAEGPVQPASLCSFRIGVVDGSSAEAISAGRTLDTGEVDEAVTAASRASAGFVLEIACEWRGAGPPTERPVTLMCEGWSEEGVAVSCPPGAQASVTAMAAGFARAACDLGDRTVAGFAMQPVSIEGRSDGSAPVSVFRGEIGPTVPDRSANLANAQGVHSMSSVARRGDGGPVAGRARYAIEPVRTRYTSLASAAPFVIAQEVDLRAGGMATVRSPGSVGWAARSYAEARVVVAEPEPAQEGEQ